jgi:hypothetical protein
MDLPSRAGNQNTHKKAQNPAKIKNRLLTRRRNGAMLGANKPSRSAAAVASPCRRVRNLLVDFWTIQA